MEPFFTNKVLVQMSEQEIIDVRTAVSNMVWQFGDLHESMEYIRYKKLLHDLDFMIAHGIPF